MTHDAQELHQATRTLFRAFHYLQGRMRGGQLALPEPMNAEALAGCILHGCISRLVREMQQPQGQSQEQQWMDLRPDRRRH